MSIVCKNESTPAGGKKGMYSKEKRAKERAEEDEEDGRRRRTVTRTTEDEGEEGGRELKSKHRLSHGRGSRYTRTLYFVTLMHNKWRRSWWTEVDLPMHKLVDQGPYHLG